MASETRTATPTNHCAEPEYTPAPESTGERASVRTQRVDAAADRFMREHAAVLSELAKR